MKHIFVVQSNFTFLAALGVVNRLGLELCDSIFVSEGFFQPSPIKVQVIPTFWGFKKGGCNFRNFLRPTKVILSHIETLTKGEAFTAYIAVATKLSRYIITHPHCASYHFFEEGMSSYILDYSLPALTVYNGGEAFTGGSFGARVKGCKLALRGYSNRMAALPIFYSGYLSVNRSYFGFTPDSHPWAGVGRVVMDMDGVVSRFGMEASLDLAGATVWIGDCVDDEASFERYISAIEELFIKNALVKQGVKKIHIKFHYRDQAAHRARLLDLLATYGVDVVVVDDSVILEVELLACRGANLYGTNSTLLFYGAIWGHTSYSVMRLFNKDDIDRAIPLFWKFVNQL